VQHLDGDVAVVPEIVREEDGRHAAYAQLASDVVAIGERGGQSRENVVVRHEGPTEEGRTGGSGEATQM